jgi:predicted  nucleic acid-binding Zn-ribbon protein
MIYIQIIDGTRKEQQAVRSKIKGLEDELRVVDTEIASIQEDLDAATARKDKAYESLVELRTVHDAKVSSHLFKIPHEKNKGMYVLIILFFFYA